MWIVAGDLNTRRSTGIIYFSVADLERFLALFLSCSIFCSRILVWGFIVSEVGDYTLSPICPLALYMLALHFYSVQSFLRCADTSRSQTAGSSPDYTRASNCFHIFYLWTFPASVFWVAAFFSGGSAISGRIWTFNCSCCFCGGWTFVWASHVRRDLGSTLEATRFWGFKI